MHFQPTEFKSVSLVPAVCCLPRLIPSWTHWQTQQSRTATSLCASSLRVSASGTGCLPRIAGSRVVPDCVRHRAGLVSPGPEPGCGGPAVSERAACCLPWTRTHWQTPQSRTACVMGVQLEVAAGLGVPTRNRVVPGPPQSLLYR
jgi:hypothetical protein